MCCSTPTYATPAPGPISFLRRSLVPSLMAVGLVLAPASAVANTGKAVPPFDLSRRPLDTSAVEEVTSLAVSVDVRGFRGVRSP